MFKWFRKRNQKINQEIETRHMLFGSIRAHYKGEVDSTDYRDPEKPEDFKGGLITPDDEGKLIFKIDNKIIEQYEGDFSHGAYNGWGKLLRNGQKIEGWFEHGQYLGKTKSPPNIFY